MKRNYNDPAYESFRKEVIKRDGRKCMMPGCGYKKSTSTPH